MMDLYPIRDITSWTPRDPEHRGTKEKFWLEDPEGRLWLFKHRKRPDIGDDWAEKVVAEIADCLGLPHAVVDLATFDDRPGIVSRDFTERGARGELLLGNQLLVRLDERYPDERTFHMPAHTVERVLGAVSLPDIQPPWGFQPFNSVREAAHVFLGYLLLDAIVGNQDRHHQNWGFLLLPIPDSTIPELAPTFDHASSLAFNLSDEQREKRLSTRDKQFTVEAYVRKGRSKLFRAETDTQALHPVEAFRTAGALYPRAREAWLERLEELGLDRLQAMIDPVPIERMSDTSKRFAKRMLECNVLDLRKLKAQP